MSHFIFKAKKKSGEIERGERDAADRYELYRMLREEGDEVMSVEEKKGGKSFGSLLSGGIFGRIKTIEKINFANSLGSMLQAGLTLSRALSVLERQNRSQALKAVLVTLIADISRGETFADALAKQPKIFSSLFISMVHAGEQSGTLAESLKAVAVQMENTYNLERRVRGAMMYPAVILTAMIAIAVLMLIFVIPTLTKTFTDLHVPLPFATQMVLDMSTIIREQGLLVFAVLAVIIGSCYWWSRKPAGKKIFHAILLRIPVVGELVKEVNTARTARTLSSLLTSGVDVSDSLSITASVVQNVHFKKVIVEAQEAIQKGRLMSQIFGEYPKLFPPFFGEMLSVGEETGKIGGMLLNVARYYEDDVEQRTKDMSTVVEPILIVLIGAAVGFFAVSMISPMYALVNAF